MDNTLNKKYGLITAIAMIVGCVIGCGVFFKADKVLTLTGGNLALGILAWVIGGLIMMICAYTFSILAGRYEKVNGVIDYADAALGKNYGYFVGWFFNIIYYPCCSVILAWLSAKYTCSLFELPDNSSTAMTLTAIYLAFSCIINALAPLLAGKIQVSATVIKLVPLFLMGIVGTIVGLTNGTTIDSMTTMVTDVNVEQSFLGAVVATSYAYDGWIVATCINAELKDAKRNLPRALIIGSVLVVAVYLLYYIGLSGSVSPQMLMGSGENGVILAFEAMFSKGVGTILMVFVIISCLGALNGMMLACTRGFYSLASRNMGPKPKMFGQVDKQTGTPLQSSLIALALCMGWLLFYFGSQLNNPSWFGSFAFDITELPIVTVYITYIPIFIMIMKKEKDLPVLKRYLAPALGIIACGFMIFSGAMAHSISVICYLIVLAVVMAIGAIFLWKSNRQAD